MKVTDSRRIARELFGSVLEPYGFSCERSNDCTFYRSTPSGVVHFVAVWIHDDSFEVMLFPSAHALADLDGPDFPDHIGCAVYPYGLGRSEIAGGYPFPLESEDVFRRDFEDVVKPRLTTAAIPHLDQFQTLEDLLPALHDEWSRGRLLLALNRNRDAIRQLRKAYRRYKDARDGSPEAEVRQTITALIDRARIRLGKRPGCRSGSSAAPGA